MTPEQRGELRDRCANLVTYGKRHFGDRADAIANYVDAMLAAERSAVVAECAKVCDELARHLYDHAKGPYEKCAAAIRKLGEKRE